MSPKSSPSPSTPRPSNGCEKRSFGRGRPVVEKGGEAISVSCDSWSCRPGQYPRESRISVVPLECDIRGLGTHIPISIPSPNAMFKNIVSFLSRRSPMPVGSQSGDRIYNAEDDYWKVALGELSSKLIETTRERDGAILEVSRLKYSMVELEKKLNRLEVYCHSLKSGLDEHRSSSIDSAASQTAKSRVTENSVVNDGRVLERFSLALSEAQKCVRTLSRLLVLEFQARGCSKVYETVLSRLFRPNAIEVSHSTDPRRLILFLDAFLNDTLFEDFESVGFQKNSANRILNPTERCKANLASCRALMKRMTWQGVLEKGTKHFSHGFSKYCDRKMNSILVRLGWGHPWPEPLLEAFFEASKSVWLVHLLANSVHPGLPVFKVDNGTRFDPVFMEDLGHNVVGGQESGAATTTVWFMAAPGFYVQGSIVKCKVLCHCQY